MESQTSKIQIEYGLFETDEVASENDVLVMLVDSYQNVEEERKRIKSRIGVNDRTGRFSSMVSPRMREMLNLCCPEYYEDDTDYLAYKDTVLGRYYDQVVRMVSCVTSCNFQEMSKLAQFLHKKCVSDCDGIETLRLSHHHYYGGEEVNADSVVIDSKDVAEFFEEEFSRITGASKSTDVGVSIQKK